MNAYLLLNIVDFLYVFIVTSFWILVYAIPLSLILIPVYFLSNYIFSKINFVSNWILKAFICGFCISIFVYLYLYFFPFIDITRSSLEYTFFEYLFSIFLFFLNLVYVSIIFSLISLPFSMFFSFFAKSEEFIIKYKAIYYTSVLILLVITLFDWILPGLIFMVYL